jgi:hypothetical protein
MSGGTFPQLAAATRTERVYWGINNAPADTEAFIEALSGYTNTSVRGSVSFSVNATTGNKIYFARPVHFGTAIFTVGGFAGGFILRSTGISVTNTLGLTVPYNLYESVSPGLGVTAVTVSTTP